MSTSPIRSELPPFGRILATYMTRARVSGGDLARHLDVTPVYVSRVLHGKSAPFTESRIQQAAALFEGPTGRHRDRIAADLREVALDWRLRRAKVPTDLRWVVQTIMDRYKSENWDDARLFRELSRVLGWV